LVPFGVGRNLPSLCAKSTCYLWLGGRQATYTASVFQTFESKAHAAANFHKLDGYKYDRDPG